jgi:hypothetical protein
VFFFKGVYTRVSVYRDWINYTISTSTRDYDTEFFDMSNNDLEIWWDRENGNNLIVKTDLLVFCLCLFFIIKIKYQ